MKSSDELCGKSQRPVGRQGEGIVVGKNSTMPDDVAFIAMAHKSVLTGLHSILSPLCAFPNKHLLNSLQMQETGAEKRAVR